MPSGSAHAVAAGDGRAPDSTWPVRFEPCPPPAVPSGLRLEAPLPGGAWSRGHNMNTPFSRLPIIAARLVLTGLLLPLLPPAMRAAAAPVTIENAILRVTWQPEPNAFAVVHQATGRAFAPRMTVAGSAGGMARVVSLPTGPFGEGQAIEVRQEDGSGGRVTLFPGQAFAFVQALLANPTAETRRFDTVPVVETGLEFGRPADSLKALGTAGLTAVDGHSGSYVFLALADPATRAGVVSAWLTHDRGCGVLFSSVTNGVPTLRAPIDYGRLLLPVGGRTTPKFT